MAKRAASGKTKKTAKKTAKKPVKKAKRQAVARAKAPAKKAKKSKTAKKTMTAKKAKAGKVAKKTKTAKKTTAARPTPAKKTTARPAAKGGKTAKKAPAAKAKGKAPARAKSAAPTKAKLAPPAAKAKPKAPRKARPAKASEGAMDAAAASAGPTVGDAAPEFDLPTDDGGRVALHDFVGRQPVVLYFYPKADTPGCTRQACDFRDGLTDYAAHGAVVIGVSPDPLADLAAFRSKYSLTFPLASDETTEVAQRYGVWVEKNNYGRTYMGIQRATFLIDRDGRIAGTWPKVSVEGHSDVVLEALRHMAAGGAADTSYSADEGEESYGSH